MPSFIKNDEKRDDLVMVCKNIFAKKDDIMSGAIQQDFLELQGFSYNEGTFDDIFMKRWNLAPAGGSDSSANSE